jgi:acyl-CoA reductase-like NAD-dependent aldehyde dehydrogenase
LRDITTISKTAKLWVDAKFIRSESGATVTVTVDGTHVEVPAASRKDARDAVTAAIAGQQRWANATPYLRGQILYRVAEMVDGRDPDAAAAWVHWAGWCDKLGAVLGAVNDVSGPYESASSPVPTGVAAISVASGTSAAGFAHLVGPALAAGCSVIAVIDPADVDLLELCEAYATSDLPAGTLNVLTSARDDVLSTLAGHSAVNVIDLTGAGRRAGELEALAAQNLTRVRRPGGSTDPLARLRSFTEIRTTWAPESR